MTNFVDGINYHFYDRLKIAKDDRPSLYQQLLAGAKKSIVIWDPHYHECEATIFSEIQQNNISIELLTICKNKETKSDFEDFGRKILKAIDDKKVTQCKLMMYALKPKDLRKGKYSEWHDRFLIIDNEEVYLVGASLDAHEFSYKSHGICRLTETDDINIVIDAYNAYKDQIVDVSGGVAGNGYKCTIRRGNGK